MSKTAHVSFLIAPFCRETVFVSVQDATFVQFWSVNKFTSAQVAGFVNILLHRSADFRSLNMEVPETVTVTLFSLARPLARIKMEVENGAPDGAVQPDFVPK